MSLGSGTNLFGDQELSDPRALRALSHPVRLAILSRLQGHGPATATELSAHVGASPSVTSWHLRHLAGFDLVRDSTAGPADRRKRYWEATARGIRFELADDEEGRLASEVLSAAMLAQCADLVARWAERTLPALEGGWRREAGVANTGLRVTLEELERVNEEIERLLAPYVTRADADRPEGTRRVRLLRYTLPSDES